MGVKAGIHRCPKCAAYFNPPREAQSECPHCGIFFHKWQVAPAMAGVEVLPVDEFVEEETRRFDPVVFYGRLVALVLVTVWGLHLASLDYRVGEIGGSFMHNILLPIHEAGHVFFMPFGEFLMTLGGSLLQVALPFGIGVAFLWKRREPFGAAIMLWWTGASFVDLSPYVWDALDPQLTLLGGRTGADGPHDWIYLLGTIGSIHRAHGWGTTFHHFGVLMMAAGVAWAGWYLWGSWKKRALP